MIRRRMGNGWGGGKRATQRPRVDLALIVRIDRIAASIGHSRDDVIGMLLADALTRIEVGLPGICRSCGGYKSLGHRGDCSGSWETE